MSQIPMMPLMVYNDAMNRFQWCFQRIPQTSLIQYYNGVIELFKWCNSMIVDIMRSWPNNEKYARHVLCEFKLSSTGGRSRYKLQKTLNTWHFSCLPSEVPGLVMAFVLALIWPSNSLKASTETDLTFYVRA